MEWFNTNFNFQSFLVPSSKSCYKIESKISFFIRQFIIVLLFFVYVPVMAQNCPTNIDFESGTFDGWKCYTGFVADVNGKNVITLSPSGPVTNRHTMYTRSATPQLDPYGSFPVNCPNGSLHSIRLGNDLAGTEAEGVSYEFTIPANRNVYSLIYHYAVVFQDPAHLPHQQPRMEIEITNVTDNEVISCSSFTFFPIGSPLPGFFLSNNPGSSTPVWCKDWSAVSINLDGNAGKTIRLFFKTADCTFRRHFGYAYIDVNSECSGEFTGATFCHDDTAVQVVAPYGYQGYKWFNNDFSQVLGNEQTLTLKPPPSTGTTVAVEVTPYFGYGCVDTLYAKLLDTLTVKANAGPDKGICNNEPVQLGVLPRPGIVYSWSPANGLTDATIANPFANPDTTTTYVLTNRSYGGGCVERDTVLVSPVILNANLQLIGKAEYCLNSGDSAVLTVTGADSVQWFKDDALINGATSQARYRVNQSGTYYAKLYKLGCVETTDRQMIYIETPKPGIKYPIVYWPANDPVPLQARPLGDSVIWRPPIYLNTTTSPTPIFNGSTDQLYSIQITTHAGCVTVDTQQVKIVKEVNILVPTAFTPNGDGLNDVLRPTLFGIRELRYFRVYNRWGDLLFEGKDPQQGWDGKISGRVQANQVVVWVAEGIGLDGRIYLRKGTSVVIQ